MKTSRSGDQDPPGNARAPRPNDRKGKNPREDEQGGGDEVVGHEPGAAEGPLEVRPQRTRPNAGQ